MKSYLDVNLREYLGMLRICNYILQSVVTFTSTTKSTNLSKYGPWTPNLDRQNMNTYNYIY